MAAAAFQANAFQVNAFQTGGIGPPTVEESAGVTVRTRRNLVIVTARSDHDLVDVIARRGGCCP